MRRDAILRVIMIDTKTEQLLPLRSVPNHLEKRGAKRPHVSAVHRWMQALTAAGGV